jgi:histidinol-phosphate aminotransferase
MAQDVARDLAEHRLRRSDAPLVDLSTVRNPYGPPPAVLDALRFLTADDVAVAPTSAAARLEAAYAELLGVDPAELLAGRGPSEFLWALGRTVPHGAVAVPLPARSELLDVFPDRKSTRLNSSHK